MTTTIAPFNRVRRSRSAFTLTELMLVMTLTVILTGAIFAAFGFVMRGSFAIANYSDMTSEGRRGLEVFARDVRQAADIIEFSEESLTLYLNPLEDDPYLVTYRYNESDRTFEREQDGEVQVLMRDIRRASGSQLEAPFRFRRFKVVRTPDGDDEANLAMNHLETKQLQLQLSMVKRVLARDTSEKVVSARYVMRNKKVTE